jgi:hypothetical protein
MCAAAYEEESRFCTMECFRNYQAAPQDAQFNDQGLRVESSARYIDGGGDLAEALEDILGAVFAQETAARRLPLTWGG